MSYRTVLLLCVVLFSCFFMVRAVTPADQIAALQDLYAAAGGTQWSRKQNWLQQDPCDNQWQGVTCITSEGNTTLVSQLYLRANNLINSKDLNYTIWERLPNITSLDLADNSLIGLLRMALPAAQHVDVSFNGFEGTPSELFLPSLASIDLSFNNFGGPVSYLLQAFNTLQSIAIVDNQFSGFLPPQLFQLPNFVSLYATHNHISGSLPSTLSTTSMRILHLANNSLSGIIPAISPMLVDVQLLGNAFQCPLPYLPANYSVTCSYCAAGYTLSGSACNPCPAGFISIGNSNVCTPCPENTANPVVAGSSCSPCPSGYHAPKGSLTCFASSSDFDDSKAEGALVVSIFVLVLSLITLTLVYCTYREVRESNPERTPLRI
jgi:hypothetical protein